MNKIAHGAEAVLYNDPIASTVMKQRLVKGYRLPALDESLRKFRTRREAKVLSRLQEMNFPAPQLRDFCDKRMSITMDFVPGEKLKDVLENNENSTVLASKIGKMIGKLHHAHIIHGDLTTSNMILDKETDKVNFIDFGLSFFSEKVEDKAVDLFLLDRALESTHAAMYPNIFEEVLTGYKDVYPKAEEVLERFKQVQARGRNKNKG